METLSKSFGEVTMKLYLEIETPGGDGNHKLNHYPNPVLLIWK